MTRPERLNRNLKITKYLCEITGKSKGGFLIYRTYDEASRKFGLHATHCFRIKKIMVGLDNEGKRELKEEYLR